MSTTSKGTEYELLVQNVMERLHAAEGVNSLKIKHNVTLKGISGTTHQIDLYWEFEIAGIIYRVAVECKNYAKSVTKERIAAFKSVLDDIGNIKGIYVCKSGYQKGAKLFAEAYGIQLMEIRHPTDEDWKGRIRDIHNNISIITANIISVRFGVDKDWAVGNGYNLDDIGNGFQGWTDQTAVISYENGVADKKTLHDIINSLPRETVGKGFVKTLQYEEAFLDNEERNIHLKIKDVRIVYDLVESAETIHIYGDDVVMAIVKNIQAGENKTVAYNGAVWDRE